ARDPAAPARETSSHEPETLEQSCRSQTERGIGPTGVFECCFELHLVALKSVVPAFWTRPGQLGRRLQQRLEVRSAHGRILRGVLLVIRNRIQLESSRQVPCETAKEATAGGGASLIRQPLRPAIEVRPRVGCRDALLERVHREASWVE